MSPRLCAESRSVSVTTPSIQPPGRDAVDHLATIRTRRSADSTPSMTPIPFDGVPKPIAAAVPAAILALLGGVAFAVRKTSTEHPPGVGTTASRRSAAPRPTRLPSKPRRADQDHRRSGSRRSRPRRAQHSVRQARTSHVATDMPPPGVGNLGERDRRRSRATRRAAPAVGEAAGPSPVVRPAMAQTGQRALNSGAPGPRPGQQVGPPPGHTGPHMGPRLAPVAARRRARSTSEHPLRMPGQP